MLSLSFRFPLPPNGSLPYGERWSEGMRTDNKTDGSPLSRMGSSSSLCFFAFSTGNWVRPQVSTYVFTFLFFFRRHIFSIFLKNNLHVNRSKAA